MCLWSASLRLGMPYNPLELSLDVVPALPSRLGMGGDRRLYPRCGLHRQPVLLLLGPRRAFQLNQFISQLDCHGPDRKRRV